MTSPWRSALVGIALAGMAGLLWWGLAPVSAGGSDTYLILSGTSMLPKFKTGDLVVMRKGSHYSVGSVAAYKTPQLKSPIMHQIIGMANGRYTFKGENNPFSDPAHPFKSQIIGRLWINLGETGSLVEAIRRPEVGATLVGATAAYAAWPRRSSRARRLRRCRHGIV